MESITINSACDSNVKIRLIGHCIICLKKVNTGPDEGITEKSEEQGYPEAAPKTLVSAPGFLATFQEIWGILQNGSESESNGNGGDVNGKCRSTSFGISLEKVVAAGSQINLTLSRTPSPTICHQCFKKILAVENMMKVVRHQVRDIQRLANESRQGGKLAGRAEQIQKTLQVFTLEVDDRGTGEQLDCEDESVNDTNDSDEAFVEEKPKRRKRGRPPKPKPTISDEIDSDDQEDNSMDYHQDDNTNNSEDDEDSDFQIKTEPQDSDEDDGDDGSNYSDEFLAAGSSAKSVRTSGGRSSSTPSKKDNPASKGGSGFVDKLCTRIRWQSVDLTDEDIARDWRLRSRKPQKNACTFEYYCAQGRACQVKVKKKILRNGTCIITTNGLEHSKHRDKNYGLTKEQKEFVHKCLDEGVNGPKYILLSLKAKGFPVPKRKQVCGYLDRIRRNAKNNTSVKDKRDGMEMSLMDKRRKKTRGKVNK